MQVIGLNNVPVAGDVFEVVESVDTAREKAESPVMSLRDERISAKAGDGRWQGHPFFISFCSFVRKAFRIRLAPIECYFEG
jgi:hypothetical protein